jgi:hypothetical protein
MEGMKVVVGSWFNLPRLGTDVFSALMKSGVKYEKGMGFMFTPDTNLQAAARNIELATGQEVEISVRCFVCAREACPSCQFAEACNRRIVSPMCLCEEHSSSEEAFETYSRAFEARLAE